MENLTNTLRTLRTMLPINPTVQDIEQTVDLLLRIMPDIDRNRLIREAQEVFNVQAANYHVIEDKGSLESWLPQKKAATPWRFWNRYREYLEIEKNYPDAVLTRLSNLTDDILNKMFDPAIQRQIDKRGLVVGQVQSGKTSNYIGLICKAVDAGFRLVIILAGTLNNLRSQTQMRMDEGFFGRESETDRKFQGGGKKIGVGNLSGQLVAAHSFTSSHEKGDFNQRARNVQTVDFDTAEPIVMVVKKNGSVLRNLYDWLAANGESDTEGTRLIRNKPLLLIDDEADLASINTSKDPDKATKINHQIRTLLRLFERSAYVGYTATPFANIFIPIDNDELFPRDFIINLPAPTNYIGPEKVFGFDMPEDEEDENDAVLPVVNRIDDYQHFVPDGHKIDGILPDHLPASLRLAIRCFILTCAVRRLRGQTKVHNSMLVHVTRFKRWQGRIKELVEVEFEHCRWGIEQNDRRTLDLFRKTFEEDAPGYNSYSSVTEAILNSSLRELDSAVEAHAWADVLPHLHEAASRIRVREINGSSADVLNYSDNPNGLSVIAVGGDKLSRGLTLEGLSVSYYLRASKMYDTLMQMGRWFGYRGGYTDLCRLFTSSLLNEWYCHIAKASEELREEFEYLSEVGGTPRDYAIKVRTHPKTLLVTATNKMLHAIKLKVGFAKKLVQSYLLRLEREALESNLTAVERLLSSIGPSSEAPDRISWRTGNVQAIVRFIREFKIHPELASNQPDLVARYIELTRQRGELTDWVVIIPKNNRAGSNSCLFHVNAETFNVGMTRRSRLEGSNTDRYYVNKSNIISPLHEYFDFPDYKSLRGRKRDILDQRPPQRALLLLYPLDPAGIASQNDLPIMGYAISFPKSNANLTVGEYAINRQHVPLFDMNDLTDSDYENED